MRVCLLYRDKEWANTGAYYDWNSIVKDLSLESLFKAAAGDAWRGRGGAVFGEQEDTYLSDTVKKIMRVPLRDREEIVYRQAVLKDCIVKEGFARDLYAATEKLLEKWDRLGRRIGDKAGNAETAGNLITRIHVMRLFVSGLSEIKKLFRDNALGLESEGLLSLYERLCAEFSDEKEEQLKQILEDISFYTDVSSMTYGKNEFVSQKPQIMLDCGLDDGLKFSDMKLEGFSTVIKKYRNPNSLLSVLQSYVHNLKSDIVVLQKSEELLDQSEQLIYQIISYILSCCQPFLNSFSRFFDQLHFQMGFYCAAINIKRHMTRRNLNWCMPTVGKKDALNFRELKELVLGIGQQGEVVGNTLNVDGKRLLVITGANQGGKSTFLRSIGVAQIMLQSGLMVAAQSYQGGIYPDFFTHFTRREDSAMNSGRLDEELRRMDQILEHLGESPMLLLNESFASTTEKEGSRIAYDIVKALHEEGVRVITVTHLLSFAQQVYEENKKAAQTDVEFLSAQRLEDGTRTFKMIKHEPELTSFGLELYQSMIEEKLGDEGEA